MIAEKLRQIQPTATATGPSGISGLTVWLKADAGLIDGSGGTITANGTAIATWQNQASGGTHYNQATSGLRPTYRNGANGKYGLPVVDFNGASTQSLIHADLSAYSTGGITIFTICKWTSGQVWSANDGAGGVNYPISSYHPRHITGGDGVSNFATTNDDTGYTGWNYTKCASNVNVSYEYYPYGTPSTITTAGFASRGAAQTADCIGKHAYNVDYFTGQIGELIIYNRKLTDAECATIRTYLLTRWGMASIDNVSLLLHMDGANGSTTFTDSGPNALAATVVGSSAISTAQSQFGGASGNFPSGSYLTFPASATSNLDVNDWTIEGWLFFDTVPSVASVFGMSNGGGNVPKFFMNINMNTSYTSFANRVGFLSYNGGDRWINVAYTWSANTWYHFAVVQSGSTITLFINGASVGNMAYKIPSGITGNFRVGTDGESYKTVAGRLDEFRVTKGTARYTANFTPTGPFLNP